jgi:hypothetical protein
MKSQILAALLFSVSLAQAQDTSATTVPAKNYPPFTLAHAGDWSTEATLLLQTGNSAIRVGIEEIKFRRFIQNQFVLRTRVMATQSKEVTIINQGSGLMERSITEFTALIAPGFEKHQGMNGKHTHRLSPYWGVELPIGKRNYEYNITNSKDGQNYYNGGAFNNKVTKANTIGINLLHGFDFYVAKGVFIGTEIGYGFTHHKYGNSNITTSDGTFSDTRSIPMGSNSQLNLNFNSGIRFGIVF